MDNQAEDAESARIATDSWRFISKSNVGIDDQWVVALKSGGPAGLFYLSHKNTHRLTLV